MKSLSGQDVNRIVAGIKAKDSSTINMVYDAYSPVLFEVISQIVPDRQHAENTLVELFNYIAPDLPGYNQSRSLFTLWLLNTARDMAIKKLCFLNKDSLTDNSDLSKFERTVFALYEYGNYPVVDIAGILHISDNLIESTLVSALMKAGVRNFKET